MIFTVLMATVLVALPTDIVGFNTFRPTFHFQSQKNWMNDPCGAFFKDGVYHVYYQYNPTEGINGSDWGNIHWGHYTSKDLLTWNDQPIALAPGPSDFDKLHVFSGNVVANGIDGLPTMFYTGVNKNDIGWQKPYIKGSEQQAIAVSRDNGITWEKLGVVLSEAPSTYDVVAWRDPFIFQSLALDSAMNSAGTPVQQNTSYMIVSGGARNIGGVIPIYTSTNLKNWTLITSPIFQKAGNSSFTSTSPKFGFNFEMASVFELESLDRKFSKTIFSLGVEGGSYQNHAVLWAGGEYKTNPATKSVEFQESMVGVLDYGVWYAANSLHDPNTNRRIVWGWIPEDDHINKIQGWAGMHAIPRELYLLRIVDVVNSMKVQQDGSHEIVERKREGYKEILTLQTVGIRPIIEFEKIMGTAKKVNIIGTGVQLFKDIKSKNFAIRAKIKIEAGTEVVGFILRANDDQSQSSIVQYDHRSSQIQVIRDKSSTLAYTSAYKQHGSFDLYEIKNRGLEILELTIFVDNSVIEVFANDRFALSTRIYPTDEKAINIGSIINGNATFIDCEIFTNISQVVSGRT